MSGAGDPSDLGRLAALAERLAELRDEKRYLEGEIERVSGELAEALQPGFQGTIGALDVRVSPGRRTLRISRPADVPPELCRIQPDRELIKAHLDAGNPAPAGVEEAVGRPVVTVRPSRSSGPGSSD